MAADNVFDLNTATLMAGSESPDGRPVNLSGAVAQASAILLHRATSEADEWDEVWVTVAHPDFSASGTVRVVGIGFGGSALPVANSDVLVASVSAKTTVLVIGQELLRGGNGVWAWVATGASADVNVKTRVMRHKAIKTDAATS